MPEVASGMLPPAAKIAMPITMSLIWNVSPTVDKNQVIQLIILQKSIKFVLTTNR